MRHPCRRGFLLLVCVAAIACGRKATPPPGSAAAPDAVPPPTATQAASTGPTGIDWILIRLGDETIQPSRKQMLLRLSGDKEAQGVAICNTYRSRFELDEAGLRFGPLDVTKKPCPKIGLQREKVLLDAIQATSRWAIQGDRLILSDASGKPLAEFARRTTVD
jgi:heat shock protein HslJ